MAEVEVEVVVEPVPAEMADSGGCEAEEELPVVVEPAVIEKSTKEKKTESNKEKYVRIKESDKKTNDKKLQGQGGSREAEQRRTATLGQPGKTTAGTGGTGTMVSRRRILSRSRDDLNMPDAPAEEEDVWFSKDKLLKDHIQEVLDKWGQIDDEIWAKVIVFERNRRVAKAYARAPMLTVDGSDDGFDGFRIGLNGFENPMRERKTEEILRHVGPGVKIKMDDTGSILVKRVSRNPAFARPMQEENAMSDDVSKLSHGALEVDKPMTLFDMKKFGSNVSRELRRAYPDRRKLEYECVTAISFVKQEANLLECPCWIMIINLVAIDMLKARIPPVSGPGTGVGRENVNSIEGAPPSGQAQQQQQNKRHHHHHHHHGGNGVANGVPLPAPIPVSNNNNSSSAKNAYGSSADIKNRPKIPLPRDLIDDDPYAMVVNGSGKSSRDKPPKLPPRDLNIPKPDYDESLEEETPRIKPFFNSSRPSAKDKPKDKDRKYDDPYYCGLRARIPAFVQRALPSRNKESKERNSVSVMGNQKQNVNNGLGPNGQRYSGPPAPGHPMMWHAKSVDSGMASIHSNPYADPQSIRKMNNNDKYSWNHNFESESDPSESIYAPIYGRLPLPMRNPNTFSPHSRIAYVGEWE